MAGLYPSKLYVNRVFGYRMSYIQGDSNSFRYIYARILRACAPRADKSVPYWPNTEELALSPADIPENIFVELKLFPTCRGA